MQVVGPGRRYAVLRVELQRTRFRISTFGGAGVHSRLLDRRSLLRNGRRQVQQVNIKRLFRADQAVWSRRLVTTTTDRVYTRKRQMLRAV